MSRKKQDATDQIMGYFYQYMFAAAKCLVLDNGSIIVESLGDVTILDDEENVIEQYEIKYHDCSNNLTPRSDDFWKTLYNWLLNLDVSLNCQSLILYTTSEIKNTSRFYNWNALDELEKYKIIYKIYEEDKNKKQVNQDRKKYYDLIFCKDNYSELKTILKKFRIESNEEGFKDIKNKVMNAQIFKLYLDNEKEILFNGLYANLINIPVVKNKQDWKISYNEIIEILRRLRPNVKEDRFIIDDLASNNKLTEEEKLQYLEKNFVKEIKRIEYDEQIDSAIMDYFKANVNLNAQFKKNPAFTGEYNKYVDNLDLKIHNIKDMCRIESIADIINGSKVFYHKGMDVKVESSLIFYSESIKRGIVHNMVDSNKFTWHLEDK